LEGSKELVHSKN